MTLSFQDVYAAHKRTRCGSHCCCSAPICASSLQTPPFTTWIDAAEADDQLVYELGHGGWRDPYLHELLEDIFRLVSS